MTHAILIASAPGSETHRHAENLCFALSKTTPIDLIYFVGDAVKIAQKQHVDTLNRWLRLSFDCNIQLWVCSGSVSTLDGAHLPSGIEVAGHASWVDASLTATKIISFPA